MGVFWCVWCFFKWDYKKECFFGPFFFYNNPIQEWHFAQGLRAQNWSSSDKSVRGS